mgnify:CR=1 FL=1
MDRCPSEPTSPLKTRFAWYEKLIARACLAGVILVAGAAIYRQSAAIALGYLVFVGLGALVVVYDALCVYCPYPFHYSDCLFCPHQLVARFARLREGRIPWARQAASALVFGGIFAMPQYWLWGNWGLYATFWGLTVALALLVPLGLCRRCRHGRCPLNRTAAPKG